MPPNKVKSKIWNYFNKNGDKEAVCTICKKRLKTSGNTTNLRGHLENVHSQQWEDFDISSKKKRICDITGYMSIDNTIEITPVNNSKYNVDHLSTSNCDVTVHPSTSSSSVQDLVSPSSQISVSSTSSDIVIHPKKTTQPSVDDFINNIKSITAQDGTKSKKNN